MVAFAAMFDDTGGCFLILKKLEISSGFLLDPQVTMGFNMFQYEVMVIYDLDGATPT